MIFPNYGRFKNDSVQVIEGLDNRYSDNQGHTEQVQLRPTVRD